MADRRCADHPEAVKARHLELDGKTWTERCSHCFRLIDCEPSRPDLSALVPQDEGDLA